MIHQFEFPVVSHWQPNGSKMFLRVRDVKIHDNTNSSLESETNNFYAFEDLMNHLRCFLGSSTFLCWLLTLCQPFVFADDVVEVGIVEQAPMNVLVLYADDWRNDTLGIAGNPVVKTPTLDGLAKRGMRFTHNCVTTSICGISRASLFTGQWMSRHGNRSFKPWKTPWKESYPGLLRSNGYHVGHVGKWHNGPIPKKHFDFSRSYFGRHWIKNPDGTKIHVTQKNENDAIEFLKSRPNDKPFCLTVAFFATHAEDSNPLQFLPQPESMKLYNNIEVPVPVNATQESFERLPEFVGNEKNEGRNRWHWRFDTPEKVSSDDEELLSPSD